MVSVRKCDNARMLEGLLPFADVKRLRRRQQHATHHLAGVVVCHPGAIIPRAAMPSGVVGKPTTPGKAPP